MSRVDRLASVLVQRRVDRQGQTITARVVAVNAGPPASIDVEVHGVLIPGVRYSRAATPAVGDTAVCLRSDVDLIAIAII